MFGIFDKPFDVLQLEDIRKLISENERENQFLEYKKCFEKESIAADICAMANAQGGYLIIGISEKNSIDNDVEGYPDEIIGVEDSNCVLQILREKTKDLIDPFIFGLKTRLIPYKDKKSLLVVEVPNSAYKPHFVKKSPAGPFPLRVSRATSYWSMGDVKNQILIRSNVEERIDKKQNQIISSNPFLIYPRPALTLIAFPTFFGGEIIDFKDDRIINFLKNPPVDENSKYRSYEHDSLIPRYWLNGIEGYTYNLEQNNSRRRIHRDGTYEFSRSIYLYTEKLINPYSVMGDIFYFCFAYKSLCDLINFFEPITIIFDLCHLSFAEGMADYKRCWINEKPEKINYAVTYSSIFLEEIARDFGIRFCNSIGVNNLI